LADRIFEVFDVDKDGMITFEDYTKIMDVLCNGTDEEKN
jgi:Ca2+-binding EF-hand superfamily protein